MSDVTVELVVVGNGPLGAAVALELSRKGRAVCLVGAGYGQDGKVFSSHYDDSRIVRIHHDDVYWVNLTRSNLEKLERVVLETEQPCYTRVPVYYGGRNAAHGPWRKPRSVGAGALARRFEGEDASGGILNPLKYVAAMNEAARRCGATVEHGRVQGFHECTSRVEIEGLERELVCDFLVDTRGIFGLDAAREYPKVLGKVLFYVERPLDAAAEPFCFIDCVPEQTFRDVYGVIDYTVRTDENGQRWSISKFGFTEHAPTVLPSEREVVEWFSGEYLQYRWHREALAWIQEFLPDSARLQQIRPCAFAITQDGRPWIKRSKRVLSIRGCNGAAAKCCQALAERALWESGVLQ